MISLPDSHNAWATPQFNAVLKRELEALPVDQLPLQRCLRHGNYVLDDGCSVMVLSVADAGDEARVKVGVQFNGIVSGCSCADDPTPIEAVNEYCELWLALDKVAGVAEVVPAD